MLPISMRCDIRFFGTPVAALFWISSTLPCNAQSSPNPSPSPSSTATDSEDGVPDFDAPLSPRLWFSLEDAFTPSYDDLAGSSNTINVRGQIPLGELGRLLPSPLLVPGRLQLIKFKIPFVTSAPDRAVRGNGDTTLTALEYLGVSARKWVVGPTLKIPTASTDELGSGRWSGGPAAGYTYTHGMTAVGFYTQTFVSFAGPKSRGAVTETQLQPGLFFSFPGGWVIGTSEMQFVYNWQTNAWNNVPLGIRIEKDSRTSADELSVGVEVERNLAAVQSTMQWTFRLYFKYRRLAK